jgi:hypothetical protein
MKLKITVDNTIRMWDIVHIIFKGEKNMTLTKIDIENLVHNTSGYTRHNGVNITPEVAQFILDKYNTANREVSKKKVKEYSRIMERGDWTYYEESFISIAEDSTLNDGQHTLLASIESGTPLKTDLILSANPRSRISLINIAKPRKPEERLQIWLKKFNMDNGTNYNTTIRYCKLLNEVCKFVRTGLTSGKVSRVVGARPLTIQELEKLLGNDEKRKMVVEIASATSPLQTKRTIDSYGMTNSYKAALGVLFHNKPYGAEFLEGLLRTSENVNLKGNMMTNSRSVLADIAESKSAKLITRNTYDFSVFNILIRTYNRLYVEGKNSKPKDLSRNIGDWLIYNVGDVSSFSD